MTRTLIVNADDFGQSAGVNRGIIEAHERGIVTSASLMVRWPHVEEAAAYARSHRSLAVGLHVDLGEWRFRDGAWHAAYEVVSHDDRPAIAAEVQRQLQRFRDLVGDDPTHLDSHQHVHRTGPVRRVLRELSESLVLPLRHVTETVRYCGDFYGQETTGEPLHAAIRPEALAALVAALPPGVTELACHPGFADDLDSMYAAERAMEVAALCDPRVTRALGAHGIALVSFREVSARLRAARGDRS